MSVTQGLGLNPPGGGGGGGGTPIYTAVNVSITASPVLQVTIPTAAVTVALPDAAIVLCEE